MKLRRIPAKRTVGIARRVIALPVLGALFLFIGCSREEGTSGQDQAVHAKEAVRSSPTPVPSTDTASGSTASGRIKSYRSIMMPNEVSQTPRKDSMGMDMVPIYESEGSMLELSEHAR